MENDENLETLRRCHSYLSQNSNKQLTTLTQEHMSQDEPEKMRFSQSSYELSLTHKLDEVNLNINMHT